VQSLSAYVNLQFRRHTGVRIKSVSGFNRGGLAKIRCRSWNPYSERHRACHNRSRFRPLPRFEVVPPTRPITSRLSHRPWQTAHGYILHSNQSELRPCLIHSTPEVATIPSLPASMRPLNFAGPLRNPHRRNRTTQTTGHRQESLRTTNEGTTHIILGVSGIQKLENRRLPASHLSKQALHTAEVSIVVDAVVKKGLCTCPCCGLDRSPTANELSQRQGRRVVIWTCLNCGFMRPFSWDKLVR
jgi:hypothetical protein